MYSMTGFGRSALEIDGRKVTIELKSVNHRYLDINMRLHRSVSFVEDTARGLLKSNLNRGHIDVYLYYENLQEDAKEVQVDVNLAKSYYNAVNEIKDMIKNKERIASVDIAKMPDVLSVQSKEDDEDAIKELISQAMQEAIDSLLGMRKMEGDKQKKDFFEKIDMLESSLESIKKSNIIKKNAMNYLGMDYANSSQNNFIAVKYSDALDGQFAYDSFYNDSASLDRIIEKTFLLFADEGI